LPSFSLKRRKNRFSRTTIIFDFEIHDGADPGERVGKDSEQSAIAQAGVRGRVVKPIPMTNKVPV